jgi:protein gp37
MHADDERHVLCRDTVECRGGVDWVICGGETGPGARPIHPDWVRGLRNQCQDAGVPFCFKSWGDWVNEYPQGVDLSRRTIESWYGDTFYHVGKQNAGRALDGRIWDEYPEARS